MRIMTLAQAEDLYKRLDAKKADYIHERLQDSAFVLQHFPFHETAARRDVLWLSRAQDRLLEEFAQ
jgi:hypothetical protein